MNQKIKLDGLEGVDEEDEDVVEVVEVFEVVVRGRGGRVTIVNETFEPPIPPTVLMTTQVKNPCILGLLLDVKTRWNSTYVMLKRVLDLRPVVEVYISSD